MLESLCLLWGQGEHREQGVPNGAGVPWGSGGPTGSRDTHPCLSVLADGEEERVQRQEQRGPVL